MPSLINQNILCNLELIKGNYQCEIAQENSDYISIITEPFKILKFKNVLTSVEYKNDLLHALKTLKLERKDNDLFSLWQSEDLNNSQLKPIKKFVHILRNDIGPLLSNICNVKLNDKLSLTASLYNSGDVLLCHDDKCEDRCIAFVYYLTGSDESGGCFDMFDRDCGNQPADVVFSIPPEENSFLCFEVGNFSYHQVSEVIDDKFERWSINGWFHSERMLPLFNYEETLPMLHHQTPLEGLVLLNQYINCTYCTPSGLEQMQEEFEEESSILLKKMFCQELFESCSNELSNNSVNWKIVGPANRRHYYVADVKHLPEALNSIVKLLMSPLFISFLENITGLTLGPFIGTGTPSCQFIFELIKWLPGCYTMATDNDEFFKKNGLDLFFFFCTEHLPVDGNNSSGCVTYIDTCATDAIEDIDDSNDRELITIVPENNSLCLVYRTHDTARFTKYINHFIKKEYYAIYATYYEVETPD